MYCAHFQIGVRFEVRQLIFGSIGAILFSGCMCWSYIGNFVYTKKLTRTCFLIVGKVELFHMSVSVSVPIVYLGSY